MPSPSRVARGVIGRRLDRPESGEAGRSDRVLPAPARAGAASVDHPLAAYRLSREPFYRPVGDESRRFAAARARRLPLLVKGPSGCGKSRFVEHMAWSLACPLVTIVCHPDLGTDALLGGWRGEGSSRRWHDGPLTLAVRHGAICHLDDFGRASVEHGVALHPLTDSHPALALPQHDEEVPAHPDFQLVGSYRPGAAAPELTASWRQRFCTLDLSHPAPEDEAGIVARESGLDLARASVIVAFGVRTRRLKGIGLDEGASTRMLVNAAILVVEGQSLGSACRMAMVDTLSDDAGLHDALASALDVAL